MHILDTGPIFKFLATDCVQQLLSALGHNPIYLPYSVEREIHDTPTRHIQFQRAAEVWPRVPERFKKILSDEPTPELQECCRSVLSKKLEDVLQEPKDRGENLAILHGVLLARAGEQVVLVCDDEAGTQMIKRQSLRLKMQQVSGLYKTGGSIQHATTLTLLEWAIQNGAFSSRGEFIKKYRAMANLDSALPRDIKETGLTKSPPWPTDAA